MTKFNLSAESRLESRENLLIVPGDVPATLDRISARLREVRAGVRMPYDPPHANRNLLAGASRALAYCAEVIED